MIPVVEASRLAAAPEVIMEFLGSREILLPVTETLQFTETGAIFFGVLVSAVVVWVFTSILISAAKRDQDPLIALRVFRIATTVVATVAALALFYPGLVPGVRQTAYVPSEKQILEHLEDDLGMNVVSADFLFGIWLDTPFEINDEGVTRTCKLVATGEPTSEGYPVRAVCERDNWIDWTVG